jgi:hypothetical protein
MRTRVLLASIASAALLACGPSNAAPSGGADVPQTRNAEGDIVLAQGGRFGGGGGGGGGAGLGGGGGRGGGIGMGGGGGMPRFSGGGGAPRFSGGGGGVRFSGARPRFQGGGGAGVRWAGRPRYWASRPWRPGWGWGPGWWGWGYGVGWGLGWGYPYYYGDAYYYDDAPVVVEGSAQAYCARRFKSYDPRSGTYLGYDGRRRPCP